MPGLFQCIFAEARRNRLYGRVRKLMGRRIATNEPPIKLEVVPIFNRKLTQMVSINEF